MKVSAVLTLVALALTASVANASSLRQLGDEPDRMEKKDPDVPVKDIIEDTLKKLHPQHPTRMEAHHSTRMEAHKFTQAKMEGHKTQAKMESHKTQAKMESHKNTQAKMESHKSTQAKMESNHNKHKHI